jgi:hypothetical protein
VTALSRSVLFRALEGEPIDRLKISKEAGISNDRISSAAFQEVSNRLGDVFGFELSRTPKYMSNIKGFPQKFKDRYFVLNRLIMEEEDALHSKAILSTHVDASVEKGLLMLVLALTFCKGDCRADGSRWIISRDLYRLLHDVDDSIPEEPPAQGTSRAKAAGSGASRFKDGASLTPDVDTLLERFVHQDYLMKEKATDDNSKSQTVEEGDFVYSMGPRAAMEIGRRQVIYFCAEILDEQADQTMLQEIEETEEEEDEVFMEAA